MSSPQVFPSGDGDLNAAEVVNIDDRRVRPSAGSTPIHSSETPSQRLNQHYDKGLAQEPFRDDSKIMPVDTTDLKIALSEAKTDTKFAQLMGELGRINARLDGIERATAGTKTTIIVTGIAAVALVVAVMGYGQAWFSIGVSTRDVVKSAVAEYIQEHPAPK